MRLLKENKRLLSGALKNIKRVSDKRDCMSQLLTCRRISIDRSYKSYSSSIELLGDVGDYDVQ